MAQPRLVLVDDTDSSIQYSGPWFTAQNTQLNTGDFGPPFQNTLHGVNVDASFSYSFSGSSVSVLGTSITTNASGSQDPTWECFIDNKSIGWKTVLQYAENNWIFCSNSQLQDGPHVLSVNAKVSNQQTFWFDQIQYLPSSNDNLDQSMIRIDSSDAGVQYSSGWSGYAGIVDLTQNTGATVTLEFSGVSLSWLGLLPPNFPLTAASATYSIDGQSQTSFTVPNGASELYNQVLFHTGQLSAGQHKLVVTYQGNSGTAPLALDYFVIQDAPSSSSSSPGGNGLTQSPSSAGTGTANSAAYTNLGTATNGASSMVSFSSYIPTGSGVSTSGGVHGGSAISSSVPSNGSSSGSSNSSGSTSNLGSTNSSTTMKMPLGAIIGGVLGGLTLLSLLLILFLFIRRRQRNQGAQKLNDKSYPYISPDTVDPFTLAPSQSTPVLQSENYASEGQPLIPQSTTNKFSKGTQPTINSPNTPVSFMRSTSPSTDATGSVSGGSGGGSDRMSPLTPLRKYSSSPAATASPQSPDLSSPATVPQTNLIDGAILTKAQEAGMAQRSASPQSGDAGGFLRHEDSGLRMPPATPNSLVELPPLYTPG